MKKEYEITDMEHAANILYGLDDGQVRGEFVKLVVKSNDPLVEACAERFCCEDFRLVVESYKKVTIKTGIIRFSGSSIYYCPFCGKKFGGL